jgi:hypothetical protein
MYAIFEADFGKETSSSFAVQRAGMTKVRILVYHLDAKATRTKMHATREFV